MTQDVVISGSLRENLLSLKKTARVLDETVLKLATGLTVNSALDNPQNFFTARALGNTAGDLSRLLDSIGQSIQTIKETDTGLTALSSLTEQAESVAQQAVELNNQRSAKAAVTGNTDITGGFLADKDGIDVGDVINFVFREDDTLVLLPIGYGATITATTTAYDLAQDISDIGNGELINAEVLADGTLYIETLNNNVVNITFRELLGTANSDLGDALGFAEYAQNVDGGGFAADTYGFEISTSRTLKSYALENSLTGEQAVGSDTLSLTRAKDGSTLFFGIDNALDVFDIGINQGTTYSVGLNGITVQGFVDAVNNIETLQGKLEAEFDDETGQILITAIDDSVESIQMATVGNAITYTGFGFTAELAISINSASPAEKNILLGQGFEPRLTDVNRLEDDFDTILEQITQLTEDTEYRGIKLLAGDVLTTYFNPDLTSSIKTVGKDLSSSGLGFEAKANYRTAAGADESLENAQDALDTIRDFQRSLANNLAVIQARQDFIKGTIVTHNAGADDLTVADQNEEGANLLALQTRQALGITALSIGAQQQQSVLRLF